MLIRTAIGFLLLLGMGPGINPAYGDSLEDIRKSGELTWGADPQGGAPYVFPDPANPAQMIGFEADLAQAIADKLGVRARLVPVDWTSLLPALKRGDFHIALNGLEWTAKRNRAVALSDPYYIYSQQLVTRKINSKIQTLRDLPGKVVATLEGAVAGHLLKNIPGVNIRSYEGQVEPYRDLGLGRVDAVLMDLPIAEWNARADEKLSFRGEPFSEGLYVIATRKKETRLLDEINRILGELRESGTLEKIYRKWNLWNRAQLDLKSQDHSSRKIVGENTPSGLDEYLFLLLKGAGMTIVISISAMMLAIVLGIGLTGFRLLGGRVSRSLAVGYIEIMRGTPLLLQLYIIYYGLPNIGIQFNAFTAAVLGLGLNYAAYESEIYRAGLNAVPHGQLEAGQTLGMTRIQIYKRILVPQAFTTILPPSTNDFIALFKDSSLVSIIAIVELTKTYNMLAVSSMQFLELGILTALLYLAMSLPLSIWSSRLERKAA